MCTFEQNIMSTNSAKQKRLFRKEVDTQSRIWQDSTHSGLML